MQPPVRVCEFDAAETYCENDPAAEYLLSSANGKRIDWRIVTYKY